MGSAVFSPAALRLQPFALLPDGVYAKTSAAGSTRLITAMGVEHPLRRLASWREWDEHTVRLTKPGAMAEVGLALAAREDVIHGDAAAYFEWVLVPAFRRREAGEDEPVAPLVDHLADKLLREVPPLRMPMPGMLIGSRVWTLAASGPTQRLHVRTPTSILSLTGAAFSLRQLDDRWRQEIHGAIRQVATSIRSSHAIPAPLSPAAAREFELTGAIVRGDLVFLGGATPRLGHVLPDHYNGTLRRAAGRDLLLTAPFLRSSSPGVFQMFERGPDNEWHALAVPNGLCLGADAPPFPDGLERGVALAAFLRWAAIRLAGNGRFHERD